MLTGSDLPEQSWVVSGVIEDAALGLRAGFFFQKSFFYIN